MPKSSFTNSELKLISRFEKQNKLNPNIFLPLLDDVQYKVSGNFTYAFINVEGHMLVGAAKRNPKDLFNEETGKAIAFCRAISK